MVRTTRALRLLLVLVLGATAVALAAGALPAGAAAQSSTDATVNVTTLKPDPGETDAHLGGELTALDGADGANLTVEYRRRGASEWRPAGEVVPAQSPRSYYVHVEGLAEGTAYEYRARAETWDGSASDVGEVVGFETVDAPAIRHDELLAVNGSSASVRGNLTDLGAGADATVQLEYRAAGGDEWFEVGDERTYDRTGYVRLSLDGLAANTTYEYRLVAIGADDLAHYGDRHTLTTDEPADVRTRRAYVDGTRATMVGEVVSNGDTVEASAHVAYRRAGTEAWTRAGYADASEPTVYAANVSGLDPGATYEYRAVLWTTDGDDDRGEVRSFETGGVVDVTTGAATDVSDDGATLGGELHDLGGADAVEVRVQYRERGSDAWSASAVRTLEAPGSFSVAVDGLSPGTTHEYRAVASAGSASGDVGAVRTFATDTAPAVATGEASDVEPTAATLSGSLDRLGGADVVDLAVEYREAGSEAWQTLDAGAAQSPSAFDVRATDLAEQTTYEYRAVGTADDGVVVRGAVRTVETPASTVPPAVTGVEASEDSPPNPHAEVTVDWAVADDDGDLVQVRVDVRDERGDLVRGWRRDVAGEAASGSEYAKLKHGAGQTYTVVVSVRDAEGNVVERETTLRA